MAENDENTLLQNVAAAAAGDRSAAQSILSAVSDDVYELSLRMLGHPADAEDASQEILIVILTHLGSFRGESAFSTWVWRIASNHLLRARRGRREQFSFEVLSERLRSGLREEPADGSDPFHLALGAELRLRCTEAMLLCLDRDARLAHILADVFGLSGALCAEILEVEPAVFRKRASRARERLRDFMGGWCGLFDPKNPCRCGAQVESMRAQGRLDANDLSLLNAPKRPSRTELTQAAHEMGALIRVAEVIRGDSHYAAPQMMVQRVRQLLAAPGLGLLHQ